MLIIRNLNLISIQSWTYLIFYRNSRQNTTSICLSLFSFPNPIRGTNLNCFTNALQYCVTVFKRIITERDVKMTSQLVLWIILIAAFN